MRLRQLLGLVVGVLSVGVGLPTSASALTLGDLASADPGACAISQTAWVMQFTSSTAQYTVPAGGGAITSWSTSFGPAGAPVELVVSSPFTVTSAVVRGVDYETLPNPIPADNVSTFTLAHPIAVQSGDLIGLNFTDGSSTRCLFGGAGGDLIVAGEDAPHPGGLLNGVTSLGSSLVNVIANLEQHADLGIAATVTPPAITRGDLADLTFPVSGDPIATATFTDTLPAGLVPVSASAGDGSCSVGGQLVSCTLNSTRNAVNIVVRGSSTGMYTDAGNITSPLPDPNPANNTASTTLAVVRPTTGVCEVPTLRGAPLSVAKATLRLLNCRVGKIRRAHSARIPRGDVISTRPAPGTTASVGTKVAIKVSSGK